MACGAAGAQPARYPMKPIRIIVPFAPAGGTDILARSLGARLRESLGQNVIVENRPGANSIIGTDAVAKSAPDGHTLLFTTQVLTINPSLHASMPYQAERDFAPVTIAASAPNLLAVHPSIPVRDVKQLVALARATPGAVTIAAAGVGTPSHLAAELFRQMAKVDLLVVQYKGGGNSLADVAGGQVATTFGTLPSLTPLVESGKLRALAVSGATRQSSDDLRIAAGFPERDVVRGPRAFEDSAGDRGAAARRDRQSARASRTEAEPRRARFRSGRHAAGGDGESHQGRDSAVGESDSGREYSGGVALKQDQNRGLTPKKPGSDPMQWG
jgi:tripartite-type tricarboxylate transporter receptor subunit TctC